MSQHLYKTDRSGNKHQEKFRNLFSKSKHIVCTHHCGLSFIKTLYRLRAEVCKRILLTIHEIDANDHDLSERLTSPQWSSNPDTRQTVFRSKRTSCLRWWSLKFYHYPNSVERIWIVRFFSTHRHSINRFQLLQSNKNWNIFLINELMNIRQLRKFLSLQALHVTERIYGQICT